MKLLKKNSNTVVLLLGVLAVGTAIYYYTDKYSVRSSMTSNSQASTMSVGVKPSDPLGNANNEGSANGMRTDTYGLPPSCAKQEVVNPKELLPSDANSDFSKLNPSGSGDLQNVNLLQAGYHIGINTVGQSLRNANLQLRSEPANPQVNTGPWNKSTITGDNTRRELEIGN
jgi:hypothetical protein